MLINFIFAFFYQQILKKVFFKIDPEVIHSKMVKYGESLGNSTRIRKIVKVFFYKSDPKLNQVVSGIFFENPIGLAAGFDYEVKLTQITPSIGFGFHTVGTITKRPFEGNPRPQLGRLPKSKSLMVNKGFRNDGAAAVAKKLSHLSFEIPIGISIGRTNDGSLTLDESIMDIISSFKTFEKWKLKNSYYELNISCPNLTGGISFYKPDNLESLLNLIDSLRIAKPLFVKMPISESNEKVLRMMSVVTKHNVDGVIIGNLQNNRKASEFHPGELERFSAGNFSGKPTWRRSNELIRLIYSKYKEDLIIIGCGGVFSAEDAYVKIKNGATLIQLITGMIYEGPQLINHINNKLPMLLKKDGYTNISEAVGADLKK